MSVDKYQFYISFNDKINTAASKAVQDCKSILASLNYKDHSIEDIVLTDKFYTVKILFRAIKFYFLVKPDSIVAVQYPLLSGNSQFKYFIKASRFKRVKFFCIIHDVDDLRYNEASGNNKSKDVAALNNYDCVIVHNAIMKKWLFDNKTTVPLIPLKIFDYLTVKGKTAYQDLKIPDNLKMIAFAGNLSKSNFIYTLNNVKGWYFNLYGPNYRPESADAIDNICWQGSLSPDEVLNNIKGAFGLVWDGNYIDRLDEVNGNYLKYNNPHKLSLYLAAGLPVIVPASSAIGAFVREHNIGILINDLTKLTAITIDEELYRSFKKNVLSIGNKIKNGEYFSIAVSEAEACIKAHN